MNESEIKEKIFEIPDPELQIPIGKLGMIESLRIEENILKVNVKLTVPNCPLSDIIRERISEIASEYSLIPDITFSAMNKEELEFAKQVIAAERKPMPQYIKKYEKGKIKNIIGIFSEKGGVGKSTVTCLIALYLREKDFKVGILDGDVHSPAIATMFDANERCEIINNLIIPQEKFGIKFVGRDITVGPGLGIWRGPIVSNLIKEMYYYTDWGELDYLLIDFPPGTGDVPITAMQTLPIDGMIFIYTNSAVAKMQLEYSKKMAEVFGIKNIGEIENLAKESNSHSIPFIPEIENIIKNGDIKSLNLSFDWIINGNS
jgi:ATP-binding protein involved in chromosome partitioning